MKLIKCQLVILKDEDETVALIPLEHIRNSQIIKRVHLKKFFTAQTEFEAGTVFSGTLPSSTIMVEDDIRYIERNNWICYVPVDEVSNLIEFGQEKSVIVYFHNPYEVAVVKN